MTLGRDGLGCLGEGGKRRIARRAGGQTVDQTAQGEAALGRYPAGFPQPEGLGLGFGLQFDERGEACNQRGEVEPT
ncbi:MAG: hypothetical protein AAFY03_04605, partial [Pseudomonadota bacterium]